MNDLLLWLKNEENNFFPSYLADYQQQQKQAFLKRNLPTQKEERFKYIDFNFLLTERFHKPSHTEELLPNIEQYRIKNTNSILFVFINGCFAPQFSELAKLPEGVIAQSISEACHNHADLIKEFGLIDISSKNYPLASLNGACFTDGLFLYLPDNCVIDVPIHFLSLATQQTQFMANPRHIIILGKKSKLKWIEEYKALDQLTYFMNVVTLFSLKEEAHVEYYKIQDESKKAKHIAHTFVNQLEKSQAHLMHFSCGGEFARDDVVIKLTEPRTECQLGGYYHLTNNGQCIDYHIDVNHVAPFSQSDMLYKGILSEKSRAIFNSRVKVCPSAQSICANQANHNLLLNQQAEVYTKPELEIYSEDVKCKHGASVGQLDEEALFYLRSRGIHYNEARHMLLSAFTQDILLRVHDKKVKEHIERIMACN